ncbi:MAG: sugar phosphate isomerase/epimerase, partial [Bacillota bacterium]|nr:sugar phosphate isomerase/epimerase [Bacillota bacterium]
MEQQNYQIKDSTIHQAFAKLKKEQPEKLQKRLNLSWSNWGFGLEPLEASCSRLQRAGISYIELHGNHYGPDLGYRPEETKRVLAEHHIKVGGVCGMFSADNDLSSNRPVNRQAAIDYLRREIAFTAEMGGKYLLVVPGAVGRPAAYDDAEFERSVET